MLVVNRRKGPLPYSIVWFSNRPRLEVFPPAVFFQCPDLVEVKGMVRRDFWTLQQPLTESDEDRLSKMNSTTRNEVRQAAKLGIEGRLGALEEFESFFNAFADEKKIEGTEVSKLKSFGSNLVITKALLQDRKMAMHAYLCDKTADQGRGRVRLLYSGSARFSDSADRGLVGKANRGLHAWDFTFFAGEGYSVYDWGGIAKDTQDAEKQGINRFKEAFGGKEEREYHYVPFFLSGLIS